ncbi:hypothetical protein [Kutzneria sp. CA-103260]|uniref:hypothetical protein n=1 Tax=Kutzneria sp. CA-103260 TaxID=2802641 RepID=UPI001BABEDB4|nr:hypothetical protein [Kutzneria sp. CA-103260]QUQ63275.1 hypothetical protein JJ691_09870 [Kutzneria sp. CA-103260]
MRPLPAAAIAAALTAAVLPGLAAVSHAATTHRVLFDASKAETAGNADWIISTSQPDPLKQNASPSSDKDWTGALSSWGIALQKTGQYTLDTLPAGNTITYGTSSALDLKNFDEFVLPEPNIRLSSAEKTALLTFVQNGGGLFLVSDHTGSDRNNDGWDSPKIINDILTSNGVDNNDPFGFSVDLKNISSDHPVAISDPSNPVLNGSFGSVKHSLIANGTTFTLKPADNPNVKGLLYLSTASPGNSNAFFVTSTFGQGRVAIWGDSSTIDDGTGESGKTLYNGWTDPTADNAALALNATAWLAQGSSGGGGGGGGGNCAAPGQLLANPGFESGTTSWSGNATIGTGQTPHSGTRDAAFDGTGTTTTNTLSQTVSVPSGCSASLSFWLRVSTAETTTTSKYDTFTVAVGASTVASFSNLDASSGYVQHTVDLSAYAGQSVTLKFTGAEDYEKQTTFVLDDTALTAS